jgi:hypothetical protein
MIADSSPSEVDRGGRGEGIARSRPVFPGNARRYFSPRFAHIAEELLVIVYLEVVVKPRLSGGRRPSPPSFATF